MPLTLADAVRTIVKESRKEKMTPASQRRQVLALLRLGLRGQELLEVGGYLDLWNTQGEPWNGAPSGSMSHAEAELQASHA